MVEIRDMYSLLALARHRHFAKAAAECGISQPAFSMRIRNLEDHFSVAIVRRGNRFLGFTEEGERLLHRARELVENAEALEAEMRSAKGAVSGTLNLGVVPTALAYAAQLCITLKSAYPGITARIRSASSLAIQQGIEDRTLDAGVTYSDGTSADLMRIAPLYMERYVLLVPDTLAPPGAEIGWTEAAALPLTLLDPSMQNRRILDRTFADLGVVPQIVAESNVFTSALVMARSGLAATIVPEVLVQTLGALGDTKVLPLTKPVVEKEIALITPLRSRERPQVGALRQVINQ